MKYVPNAAQMKAADRYTIEELQVPSLLLMERAAASCVDAIYEEKLDISKVCILCGSGNNGGDGFAIARLLKKKSVDVTTVMIGDPDRCTSETTYQINLLKETGAEITDKFTAKGYSLIIDAIFGVGLSRNIEGKYKEIIEQVNELTCTKLAVDIPSGISADNGFVLGTAFKADYTVTFQALKVGLVLYPGKEYAGKTIIKDIGISEAYFQNETDISVLLEQSEYKKLLPARNEDSHKGTYGKLLVIAGCKGMSGAAYFNAMSAYVTGAGLVQIYTVEENRNILQQLLPEAIITTYDDYDEIELTRLIYWADAICIGSGIGTSDISRKIIKTTIEMATVPCVMDADGLNLLAGHLWYLDKSKEKQFIMTPHLKEMSRLTGLEIQKIKENRFNVLKEFTNKNQLTCVLKDTRTIIKSPNSPAYINITGNSAMAKAGSGDVLTGIIGGLLAQKLSLNDAAVLGVYLHGRSGDKARKVRGSYSVLARDLIEYLAMVLKEEER